MGIIARTRDIIGSNVNALLDKAENPEKLVRYIVREMEDTLVELKASCAGALATEKRIERELDAAKTRAAHWSENARLAVEKGRDDLAREALVEKRRHRERVSGLEEELDGCRNVVGQYRTDIAKIEEKLTEVREKQRILVQRHVHAKERKRAELDIRKWDTSGLMMRFEEFQRRVDRLDSEADLVNFGRKPSIEDEFAKLRDDSIERELEELKAAAPAPAST
jgi:phage shock protein A